MEDLLYSHGVDIVFSGHVSVTSVHLVIAHSATAGTAKIKQRKERSKDQMISIQSTAQKPTELKDTATSI